ncbi:MAG: FecR domain-containing protein [Proteobacteria bacterium]|nr:FecR domain-containing protein [Pseudomonadota bacterium]
MGRMNEGGASGCELVARLFEEQTGGRILSADEFEIIERHVAECAECGLERRAVAAMRIDGPVELPRYIEDDIARRRWLDDAVAAAAVTKPRTGTARRRAALLGAVAAAAACAAVVVTATVGRLAEDTRSPVPASTASRDSATAEIAAPSAPAPSSGAVLLGTEIGLEPGRAIARGDTLVASEGALAIALDSGIKLLLLPGARVRIPSLDEGAVEVRVDAGDVVAAVEPKRSGPPFSVTTASGSVGVVGTVFEVGVADGTTRVGVLRGEVSLRANGRTPRALGVGETSRLDGGGRRPLEESESRRLDQSLRMLDLLSDSESASAVDIQSLPTGAQVSLDGVLLGSTPVAALVRSGHRTVELTADGRAPVRELVELARSERLSRVFELGQLPPKAGAASRAAAKAGASEMLARAQELRAAREWGAAAEAYEELISIHPKSTEARTSLVSLGELRLVRLGAPEKALECYASYLETPAQGALAPEALYGKARALRALGREDDERDALEAFIGSYPNAFAAPQAAARLTELEGGKK